MRKRNVTETDFFGDFSDFLLVALEVVAVDENNGDGVDSGVLQIEKAFSGFFLVQWADDLEYLTGSSSNELLSVVQVAGIVSGRINCVSWQSDSLVDFHHFREKHTWLDNVDSEQVRTRAVTDVKQILESFGGDQGTFCSLSLQQGVGSDSGSQSDRGNKRSVERSTSFYFLAGDQAQNSSDTLDVGIFVIAGIDG